jgi:predicted anti-sigma-YlaC factor YlaD
MKTNHITEDELVAFFDGEIERSRREQVAEHVAECRLCRNSLDTQIFSRAAIQSLPLSQPSDAAWSAISSRLEQPNNPRTSHSVRIMRFRPITRRDFVIAAAACLALAVLTTVFLLKPYLNGQNSYDSDVPLVAASTLFDWGLFLTDLDHPATESRFENSYSLTPVSLAEAVEKTGFTRVGRPDHLPSRVEFRRARLVQLPGAIAVQIDYDWDGTSVVVFFQEKDSKFTFSGFTPRQTTVREIPCLSVYCTNYRALTAESPEGIITIVSERSSDLVEDAIRYFVD